MSIHSLALATKANMQCKYTNIQPHTNTSIHLHKHTHTHTQTHLYYYTFTQTNIHTWNDYYKLITTFPVNHVKRYVEYSTCYIHANSKYIPKQMV